MLGTSTHLGFSLPCLGEMYASAAKYKRTRESNLCILDYFHHLTASLFPDSILTSFVQKKSAIEGAAVSSTDSSLMCHQTSELGICL